jgi:predicted secreted Zn-dependent protease
LVICGLLCLATHASAKEQTKYLFYNVKGNTAPAIYADIKTSAPKVVRNAIFAYMAIATKTNKRETKRKAACGYTSFNTSALYYITLPRLAASAKPPQRLRRTWAQFAGDLKTHEEWHRDNWRRCLKDYDRKALALTARDCASLDRKREALFISIKTACVEADERFDFQFRKDVLKHPFLVEAQKEP